MDPKLVHALSRQLRISESEARDALTNAAAALADALRESGTVELPTLGTFVRDNGHVAFHPEDALLQSLNLDVDSVGPVHVPGRSAGASSMHPPVDVIDDVPVEATDEPGTTTPEPIAPEEIEGLEHEAPEPPESDAARREGMPGTYDPSVEADPLEVDDSEVDDSEADDFEIDDSQIDDRLAAQENTALDMSDVGQVDEPVSLRPEEADTLDVEPVDTYQEQEEQEEHEAEEYSQPDLATEFETEVDDNEELAGLPHDPVSFWNDADAAEDEPLDAETTPAPTRSAPFEAYDEFDDDLALDDEADLDEDEDDGYELDDEEPDERLGWKEAGIEASPLGAYERRDTFEEAEFEEAEFDEVRDDSGAAEEDGDATRELDEDMIAASAVASTALRSEEEAVAPHPHRADRPPERHAEAHTVREPRPARRRSLLPILLIGFLLLGALAVVAYYVMRESASDDVIARQESTDVTEPLEEPESSEGLIDSALVPPVGSPEETVVSAREETAETHSEEQEPEPASPDVPTIDVQAGGWTVVVGSATTPEEANEIAARYRNLGHDAAVLYGSYGGVTRYRIVVDQFANESGAIQFLQNRPDGFPADAWRLPISNQFELIR